jgi:hypothetical protein
VLVLAGCSNKRAGAPGMTVKVAEAPVSPADETDTVTVPTAGGLKLDAATPLLGVTGDPGVNADALSPFTPLATNVTGLTALVTVFPFASCTVAV